MYFARCCCLLFLLLTPAACGSMADDLAPSGSDNRTSAQTGTTGPEVGQIAPDFSIPDINGTAIGLSEALSGKKAIVLYFTMWCPICDSHMGKMLGSIIPSSPDAGFYAVDYISGSVADAKSAALGNGYANTKINILADTHQTLLQAYHATMGTTVVIDSTGIVRMNEDYLDGSRLQTVLSGLQ